MVTAHDRFVGFSFRQVVKDHRNHDARIFDAGFAMADFRIDANALSASSSLKPPIQTSDIPFVIYSRKASRHASRSNHDSHFLLSFPFLSPPAPLRFGLRFVPPFSVIVNSRFLYFNCAARRRNDSEAGFFKITKLRRPSPFKAVSINIFESDFVP